MTAHLTNAQNALLKRLHVAPVKLYGGEWSTFYRLRSMGLAEYMVSDDGKRNYSYGVITPKGEAEL